MGAFSNPELVRNARAQLRWERMVSTAAVCGVLSLVVGYVTAHSAFYPGRWGLDFLGIVVRAQVFLLLIIGGLSSLQTIQREKDLNTFDFQRVTRLTSLELASGKILGAPIFAYFIALCLVPAVAVGAVAGRAHVESVLAGFAIVLLGAIGFHAFALVLSLLVDRATGIASTLLLIFLIVGMPSVAAQLVLHLGPLSPSVASDVITGRTGPAARFFNSQMTDVFFGLQVAHTSVLPVLYATFTGWCLLALVRNIKRDPAVYEIFTPWQALGFAAYVNVIIIGFFNWKLFAPLQSQGALLAINAGVFFALGLMLLRNRDRVRRLRERHTEPTWVALTWPAPYLVPGTLLVGLATIAAVEAARDPGARWDPWLAAFRVAVFSAWILRDILYLQWMNLIRGRRPLLTGLLYLAVFYTCVGIISVSLHLFGTPAGSAYVAIFAPSTVLGLSPEFWANDRLLWIAGLCTQVLAAAVFVSLQRRAQVELSAHATETAGRA